MFTRSLRSIGVFSFDDDEDSARDVIESIKPCFFDLFTRFEGGVLGLSTFSRAFSLAVRLRVDFDATWVLVWCLRAIIRENSKIGYRGEKI